MYTTAVALVAGLSCVLQSLRAPLRLRCCCALCASELKSLCVLCIPELKSLSRLTSCRILVKAEHMNPSGSIKDRAALSMVEEMER